MSKKNIAVVTGSTRGIGFGLAKQLLRRNCKVVINGRSEKSVNKAIESLKGEFDGSLSFGVPADVSQPEQVKHLWVQSEEHFGAPDIWINNAGVDQPWKYSWEISSKALQKTVHTNILGVMYGSKIAAQNMLQVGKGQIYNVEGLGSDGANHKKFTLYGTTKRAVAYYTKGLIKELNETPIQVGRLNPGLVYTDLLSNSLSGEDEESKKVRRLFNILVDDVDDVTKFLADKILENNKHGAHIKWLTKTKVAMKFLKAPFQNNSFFKNTV